LRILLKLLMVVVLGGLAVANLITSERSVDPRNPSIAVRYAIARTSAGMIRDEPWWGYGPGSYRFVAPYYLKRNPLFTAPGHADVLRYSANYAHSDWVQIPAEWGVAGAVLFAAVLAWWAGKVWRLRRALPADSWCVIAPVALVLFAAALDFPTYNPAVLVVLAGALAGAVKLGEIAGRARTGTA
jgi:O-antigen ligase